MEFIDNRSLADTQHTPLQQTQWNLSPRLIFGKKVTGLATFPLGRLILE